MTTTDRPGIETPEIEMVESRTVYENRWMRVREDRIRRADGSPGLYGVVEKPDFVVIVPVEPDGSLHLVEQYRYPVAGRFWELPQGSWEEAPGADPEAVARGELAEETGLRAGRITEAGRLFLAYGYSSQAYRVFLAEDVTAGDRALDPEEQGLVARRFPREAVRAMIADGTIRDAATLAAFALLAARGLYDLG